MPSHPPGRPPSPVTLAVVAQTAGVSKAMASRALHGTGPVAAEKKNRIIACADRLGYRADARLAYLSALRWGHRSSGQLQMAWLCDHYTVSNRSKRAALESEAAELGYGLIPFILDHDPPVALDRTLYHRGIRGLLIDLHDHTLLPPLTWERYSVILLGDEQPGLSFHRVSTDWAVAFDAIAARFNGDAPPNIGIAIRQFAGAAFTRELRRAAFGLQADWPGPCRVRSFDPSREDVIAPFVTWVRRFRFEVVVVCSSPHEEAAVELRAGEGFPPTIIRLGKSAAGVPAIDFQLEERARAAASLLHTELLRNRCGPPPQPMRHLVPPVWHAAAQGC